MMRREFTGMLPAALAAAPRPTKDDISMAAWSINRSFFQTKRWKNEDLPRICREEFGINGLEFVNQFFDFPMLRNLARLKKAGSDYGVKFVLIMIDSEGDMAAKSKQERMEAAVAHRKWVDIANYLGCHAVRCNLGGPRTDWQADKDLVPRAAESFNNLVEYAKESGLSVVIENHGGASSDPDVLVPLMKMVNKPAFGTLPDFGNQNPGMDPYEVIRKIVPWAKGISVKSGFKRDGSHPRYELEKMIQICKDSGYHGFWGIESGMERGENETPDEIWASEAKAVKMTKAILEKTVLGKG